MEPQNYIDLYCERTDGSFWSEPVNALTNFGFILAAFLGYKLYQTAKNGQLTILLLVINAAAIGVGSFLFHTLANGWSAYADIIPIALFILVSVGIYITKIAKLKNPAVMVVLSGFLALIIASRVLLPRDFLNGSIQYLPAFLALFGIALHSKSRVFALAGLVFVASLAFRSIDMQVCNSFPLGSHFMWHLLNSVVIYLVIRGLAKLVVR